MKETYSTKSKKKNMQTVGKSVNNIANLNNKKIMKTNHLKKCLTWTKVFNLIMISTNI